MGFQLGQKAGGYEFLRLVDTSGAGVTYEVQNEIAQRRELLKVLPRDLQEDHERVERFLREAKIHSHLSHPNIASFYSAMELDGQLVMTMEAVDGMQLEERLAEGPVSLSEAVDITKQALSALSYAHKQDVVHREITPQNLILNEDGRVKLTGFGLAKQAADAQLTQPGLVMGSAYYMSPEQVKGDAQIDGRSDLYSLGIVLYEMVAGTRPFDSKSQFEVIQAHVMRTPPPPSDLRAELPESFEAVILKALEKDPDARFADADAMVEALDAAQSAIREVETRVQPLRPRGPIEEARVSDLEATKPDAAGYQPVKTPEPDPDPLDAPPSSETDFARPPDLSLPEPKPTVETPVPSPVAAVAAPPKAATGSSSGGAAANAEPEGWSTRDLVIVGSLTFVMIVALVMAAIIVLDR